jgi:hypothetical protein
MVELWRRRQAEHDESGAILVLALIFTVITALLISGLAAWAGNDIKNIGNLTSSRTAVYAANGAIQTAIYNTRYSFSSNTTAGFCPSTSQSNTDPFTLAGRVASVSIDVWCTYPTQCPIPFCSRVVTMSAYPAAQCTSTACIGSPYVQAEVVYDDNTSLNYNDCTATGAQTTCGSTMTIYSYVNEPNSS